MRSMRIPRFYTSAPLQTGQTFLLPPELFRHAIQVLRLQRGDPLILFNGLGGEFQAEINTVSKREASATIQTHSAHSTESPLSLTLAQSIIKPDKMDFAIQKVTELGVHHIQPIISQRSVVRIGRDKLDKKLAHWEAVALNACEQSGRTGIPTIQPPQSLEQWLTQITPDTLRLLLMPGDYPRLSATDVVPAATRRLEILIGPEGGFTEEEVEQCMAHQVTGVSLGPRILRAETAAITVIALLQQHLGDL